MSPVLPSYLPPAGRAHPHHPPAPTCGRTALSALIHAAGCLAGFLVAAGPAPGQPAGPAAPVAAPAVQAAPLVFPADDRELLAVDDDMRRFFAQQVDADDRKSACLRQIVTAILSERGLHFAYEKNGNYSAGETFRRRGGNCLSFSLLAVAVARLYGLEAKFCEVDTYPRWDRSGNFITEIRHLDVRVWANGEQFELDPLGAAERNGPVASARVVSDARAFAHFYNNQAVRRLEMGDRAAAQKLFDRALAADPTAAFVWANKGSALRLAGDPTGAQNCLERAVREDPQELAALSSLATFYAEAGRLKQAAKLEKKVRRYRLQNPYYLSFLAHAEYAQGDFRGADGYLRRAIGIKDDEPEFYELRILVAQGLGRTADAQHWAAKLQALQARSGPTPPVR